MSAMLSLWEAVISSTEIQIHSEEDRPAHETMIDIEISLDPLDMRSVLFSFVFDIDFVFDDRFL